MRFQPSKFWLTDQFLESLIGTLALRTCVFPRIRNQYQQLLLRRSAKVLVHETAHMFSLAHCIYFKCVMNGSNHLQESDSRPLSLCPVCLRKLKSSIGFDVAARYYRLQRFYSNVGFVYEQDWVTRRLKKIEDSTLGQD